MFTKTQRKVLLFIDSELSRTGGVAPSVAEIAKHLDLERCVASVSRMLDCLVERGHIRRIKNRARAIELAQPLIQEWMMWDDETKALVPLKPQADRKAG